MKRVRCEVCGGLGVVSDYGPLGADFEGPKDCPQCEGSGYDYEEDEDDNFETAKWLYYDEDDLDE